MMMTTMTMMAACYSDLMRGTDKLLLIIVIPQIPINSDKRLLFIVI